MNGTGLKIGDLKIAKKISESTIVFNKLMNEPSSNQNSFKGSSSTWRRRYGVNSVIAV